MPVGSGTTVIVPDTTVDPVERPKDPKLTGMNIVPGPIAPDTPTPPEIDDSEMLKPVGDGAIAVTDDVSNVKAAPGVNTRVLMLLELKLPEVAPTAEVNVPEAKLPPKIVPDGSEM
jgi:hypothetical protein